MEPRTVRFTTASRLALMGGVYGNVPALRACIEHARRSGCDRLIFLGDATGCCGHSDEAVQLLRDHFEIMIQGNHETEAIAGSLCCGCGYEDPEDERLGCMAHGYAMDTLSDATRRRLAEWPLQARVLTPAGNLLLCHGSPDVINEFLYESQLDNLRLQAWLDHYDCVGMVCTHTGLPWIRQLDLGRFAVNCGVVGKPDHGGDTAVHYAIVQAAGYGAWHQEMQRVEYDHMAWAEQLKREGVDTVFTDPLRTGWWTIGVTSLPRWERCERSLR